MTVHDRTGATEGAESAPLFELNDGVLTITLNRPGRHNRIEVDDIVILNDYLERTETDPAIRAAIFTGTGQTFCSGFDLTVFLDQESTGSVGRDEQQAFGRLFDRIEALPVPTIGALNGSVYGGASDLALACDFRFGVPGAQMKMPAGALGIHYYPTGLKRYVSRLGLNAAKRLVLASEEFDSDAMLQIGFVDWLVEPDRLMEEVHNYARDLIGNAPNAYAGMKATMHDIAYAELDQEKATQQFLDSLRGNELREGLSAWRERRKPEFSAPTRRKANPR